MIIFLTSMIIDNGLKKDKNKRDSFKDFKPLPLKKFTI